MTLNLEVAAGKNVVAKFFSEVSTLAFISLLKLL